MSVIIPTYNRAHYIGEAIESVLAQTYQNFEIIVVDDGSTDGTEKVLEPYRDKIVYLYQKNQGPSVARNKGILRATGQYIAFLDSDDLWLPQKLGVQLAYMEEHPDFGLIHSGFLLREEGPGGPVIKKWPYAKNWPSGYIFPQMFLQPMVQPTTAVVRRECFETVGLFDKKFKGTEDYEMWMRIARRFKVGYLDWVLAIYRQHGVNLTTDRVRLIRENVVMIENLLRKDPAIKEDLGPELVNRGLFNRYFTLAYALFDAGDSRAARPYFARSIRLQPSHWSSYVYYLASFLPSALVFQLRQLRRFFARQIKLSLLG